MFHEKHIARHKEGIPFDLQEFYSYPSHFENNFEQYIPHLQQLINCMYWDKRYDRLITKDFWRNHIKIIA